MQKGKFPQTFLSTVIYIEFIVQLRLGLFIIMHGWYKELEERRMVGKNMAF